MRLSLPQARRAAVRAQLPDGRTRNGKPIVIGRPVPSLARFPGAEEVAWP